MILRLRTVRKRRSRPPTYGSRSGVASVAVHELGRSGTTSAGNAVQFRHKLVLAARSEVGTVNVHGIHGLIRDVECGESAPLLVAQVARRRATRALLVLRMHRHDDPIQVLHERVWEASTGVFELGFKVIHALALVVHRERELGYCFVTNS